MLIDTHCHIHESDYPLDADKVIKNAHQAGVMQMICVGTDETDSCQALEFASRHDGVFASVGIHPHYAEKGIGGLGRLVDSIYLGNGEKKLVAIGEIGLDYYRSSSSHEAQIKLLRRQIELALKYDLPIIFHIREAFDDFWSILDKFQQVRGVLHCFTGTVQDVEKAINRGLYIGVNGISTFTRDELQKIMFANLPIENILFETDAPYLVPKSMRGKTKVNEPAFVKEIAEFNSEIHNISFDEIANVTTANAQQLFKL